MANREKLERLINNPLLPNPVEWAMDADDALKDVPELAKDAKTHISSIKSHNGVFPQHNDALVAILKRALKQMPVSVPQSVENSEGIVSQHCPPKNCSIFIVHGHDTAMKSEVARIIEQQGLDALVLNDQPASGMTIIEKLEYYAKQSAFAVVLYSKDDSTETGERARQNVVFEHGLFVGCLGRDKVIAMKNGDVEGYSDIAGVEYIHYEAADWKYKLVDTLKRAGFDVSRDKIKG